ncbi:hypothetical protein LTR85_006746 [Meristemomyces frigidus]|nr:hypothetical protein LTR85_006746 [Meristemomyces frigidus]
MAAGKDHHNAEHVEHPEYEAPLAGALALASLFSNCVEAFGLILPSKQWDKQEQLLLSRLGIQQARLLIWGDIVGISSPPTTVTDRAVPKHPSGAYPDLKEPTFFGPRDARLEEPYVRTEVERALSAIVDRSSASSREEMMEKYGLKPPKRFSTEHQPALDTNRLEAFRERYELLQEVAEDLAHLNARRSNSIVQTAWTIADTARFSTFIKLTQEKVDYLITLMDVKERIDRGIRMDIKALGWHLSADRMRVAQDVSKLRLIQEVCKAEYPEYVAAAQQALDNISREARENAPIVAAAPPKPPQPSVPKSTHAQSHTPTNGDHDKHKRPGIFRLFKSFGGNKSHDHKATGRSQSVSANLAVPEPPRSQSESGPVKAPDDMESLEPIRSKSVGAIIEPPTSIEEEIMKNRLEQLNTNATVKEPLEHAEYISNMISRHDQYHGIARVATKDLRQ